MPDLTDFRRSDGELVTYWWSAGNDEFKFCPVSGLEMERLKRRIIPFVKTSASFKDGSKTNNKISEAYYRSVQKRKARKSKETIAEERGEI